MAGDGFSTLTVGLKRGCCGGAGAATERIPDIVMKGYGTPVRVAPEGSIYVKLDATMGTSSHYRMVSGTWTAMSDA
jgi:hypothetical protein